MGKNQGYRLSGSFPVYRVGIGLRALIGGKEGKVKLTGNPQGGKRALFDGVTFQRGHMD